MPKRPVPRKSSLRKAPAVTTTSWAILWSRARGGKDVHLASSKHVAIAPAELSGCPLMLFPSQAKAKRWIIDRLGYMTAGGDPTPIKVEVTVRPL